MAGRTVIEVLTQQNPEADEYNLANRDPTLNVRWQEFSRRNMTIWKDFTFDNLIAAFGELLNMGGVDAKYTCSMEHTTPTRVYGEITLETLFDKWPVDVVTPAMRKSFSNNRPGHSRIGYFINLPPGQQISITRTCEVLTHKGHDVRADAKIYLYDDTTTSKEKRDILVMGELKCAAVWNSKKMLDEHRDAGEITLRQILTYCLAGKTRYGFILTTHELVAFRISTIDQDEQKMEYRVVDWKDHGKKLTVNFTLWALAALALNERHRAITTTAETVPINWWIRAPGGFTNVLSKRFVTELLTGGEEKKRKPGW